MSLDCFVTYVSGPYPVMGSPGVAPDQFGEAHYVAASPTGEIYVADVTRGVHKFVPR